MNDTEILEKNKHISSDKIRRDVLETEQEILTMMREEDGYRLVGDKMAIFKADNRAIGIIERRKFIEKLNHLLELRGI